MSCRSQCIASLRLKIPSRREWQSTPVFLLGNPMDRGASRATVCGVAESQTQLSTCMHVGLCGEAHTSQYSTYFLLCSPYSHMYINTFWKIGTYCSIWTFSPLTTYCDCIFLTSHNNLLYKVSCKCVALLMSIYHYKFNIKHAWTIIRGCG